MADTSQGDEYSDLSLKDLQANILQSHGRGHAWHLFLSLDGGQRQIRHWISWLADQITSAEGHNNAAEEWQEAKKTGKEKEIDEKVLLCFFLSAKGYERFAFPEESIPGDRPFRLGMKRGEVNSLLQDPPSGKWEGNYKNRIDAMVLIANNSPEKLKRKKNEIEESLEKGKAGKILFIEKGMKRSNAQNKAIEHFGYVDGISQPEFLTRDQFREPIAKNLPIVLAKEENGSYGSYFVFRKLEQDVQAFDQNIAMLAHKLGVPADKARAYVAGRFPDGTHLSCFDSPQPEENWPGEDEVDFSHDPGGKKCPIHAHIRKMNHRGTVPGTPIVRIARRGITYKGRPAGAKGLPEEKPGLLFMSYQASISGQFEILQGAWANDKDFPGANTGIDPLIGQTITGEQQQQWVGPKNKKVGFSFQGVVAMKGGEYFYAPSISYLKNLQFRLPTPSARGVSSGGRQGSPSRPYAQRMNLKGNLKPYGR